jgi:hypothetical protein
MFFQVSLRAGMLGGHLMQGCFRSLKPLRIERLGRWIYALAQMVV